jgi:class 3 adenylate cyclase
MTASATNVPASSRFSGAFVNRALEREFQAEHFDLDVRRFTQFSLGLSSLGFLAFGLEDAYVLPPSLRAHAWAIRYGLFGPVGAAVWALTFTRAYARFHQAAMLVFGLSLNAVVMGIGAIAPPAGFFIYNGYAVLFVTLGPFIARMNVVTQSIYTALSIGLFAVYAHFVSRPEMAIGISTGATLGAMGVIGALVARQAEMQARQMFLQRRTIRAQLAEIDSERAKSEALLLNILPVSVAARLKADGGAIADAFADVTVLFADIVGFTRMAERLTPVEVVRRLSELFSAFDDLAEELGVEKIKTIGDAYMAASGLSVDATRGAHAMAKMALGMLARVEQFSHRYEDPLHVRIGLNSGPVVAGVIGKKKFIYDIWGDAVNTASRMESHGTPGRVHVSEQTRLRLESEYVFEPRGDVEIKGKGVMRTFYLVGPKGPDDPNAL